jgi:hypothetical protein
VLNFLSKAIPSFLGLLLRICFWSTSQRVWCPLRLLYKPVTYNSFRPAFSSVTLVVSSDEGIETTKTFEDIAAIEAFEHSAEEFALSRSRHFRHGATNSS